MPQNPIQFQPGMSLNDFFARYGSNSGDSVRNSTR